MYQKYSNAVEGVLWQDTQYKDGIENIQGKIGDQESEYFGVTQEGESFFDLDAYESDIYQKFDFLTWDMIKSIILDYITK